ncbi:hypothetical protein [Sporomusa aerivorans]|uniref:nucleotide-binding protein n=1 Tax=Sporomusa aerivorans TaxID=204936 RepID=UPI00352A8C7F
MKNNRITIMVGEFGSGKTELAANYALQLKAEGKETAIVDMDLMKPYFRTRENRELLEQHNIRVIAPDPRLAHADLPVPPQNLIEVLSSDNIHVVIDAGGGESAIALGQYKRFFDQFGYQAFLVVNTKRPFTSDINGIINAYQRIEQAARVKISGLVSNTNLGPETTREHVEQGLAIVEQAAAKLSLPVIWLVIPEWLQPVADYHPPLFVLKPCTHYPWMD